jgi:hypothetical protein
MTALTKDEAELLGALVRRHGAVRIKEQVDRIDADLQGKLPAPRRRGQPKGYKGDSLSVWMAVEVIRTASKSRLKPSEIFDQIKDDLIRITRPPHPKMATVKALYYQALKRFEEAPEAKPVLDQAVREILTEIANRPKASVLPLRAKRDGNHWVGPILDLHRKGHGPTRPANVTFHYVEIDGVAPMLALYGG